MIGLLAGCGAAKHSSGSSFVTVRGAYDNQALRTQETCGIFRLTVGVELARIDGRKIAQQKSAATWRDGLCAFPFSFGHVRRMSGYRISVAGLTPPAWLTPQQVAQPVLLSLHDAFYLGTLGVSSAAEAARTGVSGPCPTGKPAPAASALSRAGLALFARLLPMPPTAGLVTSGPPQGVLSFAEYVNGLSSDPAVERPYLEGLCFQTAAHREWNSPDGTEISVWLSRYLTTADARTYINGSEYADAEDSALSDIFPVSGVTDGMGFGRPKLDQYGNTFTVVLGDVGNVAIIILLFVPARLDNSAATSVLQQQRALLASRSS